MTVRPDWKHLVVTRGLNQGIVVDGPARFAVLEVLDGQMRIAIDAPETTKVLREELMEGQEDAG
jgi:carbon storage regulator CsrA